MVAAARKRLPSRAFLRECFDYNQRTGVLTWRVRPRKHFANDAYHKCFNRRKAGGMVGCAEKGRRFVRLGRKKYWIHRIIWKWMTGKEPQIIDHRDRNALNNKWTNLRTATDTQSCCNRERSCRKTSIPKGVRKSYGTRWHARATVNGQTYSLGGFATAEKAHRAYLKAIRRLHGEFSYT